MPGRCTCCAWKGWEWTIQGREGGSDRAHGTSPMALPISTLQISSPRRWEPGRRERGGEGNNQDQERPQGAREWKRTENGGEHAMRGGRKDRSRGRRKE